MKIKEILESFPIVETLNSTFDSLEWANQNGQIIGIGNIREEKLRLTIDPISYLKFNGLNLTFVVYDGNQFTEVFQNKTLQQSASIIGAVTNAFKDKCSEFEWEFITLVAKDGMDSRSKLYARIADRIRRETGLSQAEFDLPGSHVIFLTWLTNDETQKIVKSLSK